MGTASRKCWFCLLVLALPLASLGSTRVGGDSTVADLPVLRASPNVKLRTSSADRWLARDKVSHFSASAFLAATAYYAARRERGWRDRPSQRVAFGVAFTLGICKELWDRYSGRGTPSWKDLVADLLGTVAGVALIRAPDGVTFEGTR